jgi:hypothetical protein
LRAYVAISVVGAVVVAIVVPSTPPGPRLLLVALALAVCFFLLRRVRWLWFATIALLLLAFVQSAVEGNLR